jgi:hypothetical protein
MWCIHPTAELHGIKGTNRVKEVICNPGLKKILTVFRVNE